jgi:putative transposase
VERNPVRGGLVAKAEDWLWSSLRVRRESRPWVNAGPVPRPARWAEWVNAPDSETEVHQLRRCVNRGAPFGTDAWVQRIATRLGLEASLRPRGRPRKRPEK